MIVWEIHICPMIEEDIDHVELTYLMKQCEEGRFHFPDPDIQS